MPAICDREFNDIPKSGRTVLTVTGTVSCIANGPNAVHGGKESRTDEGKRKAGSLDTRRGKCSGSEANDWLMAFACVLHILMLKRANAARYPSKQREAP